MADISLLFDVAMGGNASEDSAKIIQSQLESIVSKINKDPLKIQFQADEASLNAMRTKIEEVVNSVIGTRGISISGAAVGNTSGIQEAASSTRQIAQNATNAADAIHNMNAGLNEVNAQKVNDALQAVKGIVASDASNLSKGLKETQLQIDKIATGWVQIAGKEQQLSNVNIKARNNDKQSVDLTMSYDKKTGEISKTTGVITVNYKKIENSSQKVLENEQKRTISISEASRVYRQMLSLIKGNNNSNQSAAFIELQKQADSFRKVINLASKDGVSLEEAIKQLGLNSSTVIENAKNAISEFNLELSKTGLSGSVTLQDIYSNATKMNNLLGNNSNASQLSTFAELQKQADNFRQVIDLVTKKGISLDEALRQVGINSSTAIEGAKNAMSQFKLELEQTGSSGNITLSEIYDNLIKMNNLLRRGGITEDSDLFKNLKSQADNFNKVIRLVTKEGKSLEVALTEAGLDGTTAIENAKNAMLAFKATISNSSAEEKKLTAGSREYSDALVKIDTLYKQITSNLEKWSAAENGKSSEAYKTYAAQAKALEALNQQVQSEQLTKPEFYDRFKEIMSTASGAASAIRGAGEATKTWYQRLGSLSEKFGTWFGITRIIMLGVQSVKRMVSVVIELDTAMTELKKVTDETDATYNRFLDNASVRAKKLGAELSDTITATADFARLGYNIADAEKLADAAIIYKNVGDGISDINEASASIIATMQAFSNEISPDDVMKVVDKFNEVGNNFAISSAGVGDALLRSAAAMQASNNTLDETIALSAAANTIVQDPEKVGKQYAQQYSNVLKENSYIG